ncbi:hypothetical protein FOA52_010153 [Chlamydomonas sp. UWO 241]|nr:hypothetical protein FOA52_010153 [Chlamydomonas sp. UWO 241]
MAQSEDGREDEDVELEDGSEEPDDDGGGSDYEVEVEEERGRAKAKGGGRRAASRPSYREDSDEEEEEADDDDASDDDDEEADSDGEYAPKKKKAAKATAKGAGRKRGAAAAPAGAARPVRRAASAASRKFKDSSDSEDADNGDHDSDEPSDHGGSDDDDDEDDDAYARKLDAEINGRRPPRAGAVSYEESDDSDDVGVSAKAAAKAAKDPLPAFEEGGNFDDEVERVLGHREIAANEPEPKEAGAGAEPAPEAAPASGDPWTRREFFIKWKRYSHVHCSWDTRATLAQLPGFKRVLNYMRSVDALDAVCPHLSREEAELQDVERAMQEQLNQQHSQVERVFSQKPGEDGVGSKYLVKWCGLPYSETTWEAEGEVEAAGGQAAVAEFQAREARLAAPNRPVDAQRRLFKQQSTRALEVQPAFLQFGKLRDYQLDGLNWMVYSWSQDRNVILADEMGLGKTVQCVAFLGYLAENLSVMGPFLVVVPLSVVPNWIREFRRWIPTMNAVVYVGDSRSREAIRAFEFDVDRRAAAAAANASGGVPRTTRFEVIITTYELILKDAPILSRIKWSALVVDEAHRLKNAESALYQELAGFSIKNKVLVTGTPLQNNLRELWALLHFLEPQKFHDADAFEEEYSLQTMDGVSGLHAVLRPHLLRRVIKEVEKSLPPKNEHILRVEMTPLQRQYYKWILSRNFEDLNKGVKGGVSLLNIIVELKKCCNHPFLFESAEEVYRGSDCDDRSVVDRLILTSGKLVLLDKLLRRLKQSGHRVLIFSQMVRSLNIVSYFMRLRGLQRQWLRSAHCCLFAACLVDSYLPPSPKVRMLDIVSDYMRLRGFQHQRLDGSTPAAARHQAMEQFNHPDSTDFAFLLSTRAGGLGINLTTADTVIIFDSDWNPQNDLQERAS